MFYANNTVTPFTNNNVAFGYEALRGSANSTVNTGLNNTALGFQTLYNNSTGYSNHANGYIALYSNTTGYLNAATGLGHLHPIPPIAIPETVLPHFA
ncbi:MAG: hypothetical protein IPG38_05330 [Chitinophagaceae bacterium]|nr:hypothetical protein [Chitinophagaceae bacterium]